MPKRISTPILLIFVVFSLTSAAVQDDPERQRAFALFKESKLVEALPLFDKLAARYPEDAEVFEAYGMTMVWQSAYLKDAAARKDARKRGRELLLKAQTLGANTTLLKSMLESIPADGGSDETFSTKKEVDQAMREGEAAFAQGDMPKAVEMYQRALALDPKLYEAALYTGDVYFKTADQKKASEWFARAVSINPDRETAYRYWADSLMKQGRVTEAGDKYVEAYIAQPYSRLARAAFLNWGQKVQVAIGHPQIEIPTNVTAKTEGTNTSIVMDPNAFKNDDSGSAWMIYGFIRASWPMKEFAKNYPDETKYRHSLKEEAAAFRAAIRVLDEKKIKDPGKIDRSLQVLMKLDKEGLLEPYILLAMPDEGIARDFVPYRRTNVENLRRYVKTYVLNGGTAPQ
jgi:tetratricopeptide (TPR) repeat protein